MRAHFLQHVPFEGLGSIQPWLVRAGYDISSTRWFESHRLPEPGQTDFLIVLGGPMSANDESRFPWLVAEKDFIRNAIAAGVPVLGICLGAQLIASAMGARVYANTEKEIGWFPVRGLPTNDAASFQFSPSLLAFHWHGETFDLPEGATRLAYSEACDNQAFQLGRSVIGLQFHLETTPSSAMEIVLNCRDELVPSRYVQTEDEILSQAGERYDEMNATMGAILAYLHPGRR